ncbi:ABC transporter substrate-binding protein [Georgenia sp. TF02-10]|uniref:ABC transporter substrate-binding protein n=1 Tax=Georgenia sp. TF02-10 TaxID=2917725 RepID=UPI001FA818E9|nr:ABC transporter substrate-binding protein [Georgenia sp. TF02-10]UNX53809.1 ABC transporter substrate-binding protein [Georgenia sp. TF02-10]
MTNPPRRRRRFLPAVAALAAAALTLTACGGAGGGEAAADVGEPVDGGVLTYAADVEPQAWDIHSSGADVVAFLQRNVFDSLVAQQPDGTFVPWLATSWEVSADSTSYEFALREDVTFHDGEKFDAEAVKANFDHIVDPDTASQYAAGLLGPYESTEVVDEYTVRVNFSAPFAAFLQAASTAYLGFYSPAALAAPDTLDTAEAAVGTGPFTLERYAKGQEVRYAKNPDYAWAPENAEHDGAAYLDELVFRFIPENSARLGALTSGQVDAAGAIPPANVEQVEGDDNLELTRADAPGMPYSLFLNTSRPPLDDVRVRQAVQRAVDLDQIVSTVYFDQYQRAWGPLSAATPGVYDPAVEDSVEHDVDAANELLDEAGWSERNSDGTRTRDGEELVLAWPVAQNQREQRDLLAQSLQDALAEVGIALDIQSVDPGTYVSRLMAVDYDVADWSFVRPEGDILRLHFHSDNIPIQNAAALSDPEIDALLEEALSTTDEAVRADLYGQVQERVVEDAVTIPVYVPSSLVATQTYVQGLRRDPSGWPLFYDSWTNGQ